MNEAANQLTAWQVLARYDQIAEKNFATLTRAKASGDFIRGLQCRVGSYPMLAAQSHLVEVLPIPEVTVMPGGPAWLLGVANRFGQLLPVVDVYGFITGKASKSAIRSLLVVGEGSNAVGLAVCNIGQAVSAHTCDAPPVQISKSAATPSSFAPYLKNWAATGDEWQPVLDVERLQQSVNQWQP